MREMTDYIERLKNYKTDRKKAKHLGMTVKQFRVRRELLRQQARKLQNLKG